MRLMRRSLLFWLFISVFASFWKFVFAGYRKASDTDDKPVWQFINVLLAGSELARGKIPCERLHR